jgi:hypothetical protein
MAKTKSHHEEVLAIHIAAEKQRFDPTMSDSSFFEIFAAQQALKDHDLSDVEIKNGIVGEGNDGGIDGLYFFVNGSSIQQEIKSYEQWKKNILLEIFIIQAKTTPGFGEEAILKLINTTEDLFSIGTDLNAKRIKQRYNPELLEIADQFRRAYSSLVTKGVDIRFHYVYATQGADVHPNTHDLTEKLKTKVLDLFPQAYFEFEFLGARELGQIAMSRPSQKIELTLSCTDPLKGWTELVNQFSHFKFRVLWQKSTEPFLSNKSFKSSRRPINKGLPRRFVSTIYLTLCSCVGKLSSIKVV